jgi:hypothetical protein
MVFIRYEVTDPCVKNLRLRLGDMQVHSSASQDYSMYFEELLRGLMRIRELESYYVN